MISKFWSSKKKTADIPKDELIEADVCPNCWGRQEYQDSFRDYIEDSTLANTLHVKEKKKAFIQQFVEDRVSGIRLHREGDMSVCRSCQSKYKVVKR